MIGSLVQGLGGAFLEHLVYDEEGQLLTGSLADYLLPTASDFPNLRAFVMDEHPSPINPLGAKGAGEGGMVGAGGVIANAVANALQSFKPDLRELPLTPPRMWEMARKRVSGVMTARWRRLSRISDSLSSCSSTASQLRNLFVSGFR